MYNNETEKESLIKVKYNAGDKFIKKKTTGKEYTCNSGIIYVQTIKTEARSSSWLCDKSFTVKHTHYHRK